MKRFKLLPFILAGLLIVPACGKQTVSKKQDSNSEAINQSSIVESSSVSPSSSSNNAASSSSTNSSQSQPTDPTDVSSLRTAIQNIKKATNYSLIFASVEGGEFTYPINNQGKEGTYSFEQSYNSQTDYYNQYWRNYRYARGKVTTTYSDLLEMLHCTDEEFKSNYQTKLASVVGTGVEKDYQLDEQTGTITFYYNDLDDEPAYTYGGYDSKNEQHYVVEEGEQPNTYIGDYLNSEYGPNEADGIADVLLENLDNTSYDSSLKAFVVSNVKDFYDCFDRNQPSKVVVYLDEKGNLDRVEGTSTSSDLVRRILFKNVGTVSMFENMPVVSRIGCEQHPGYVYDVLNGGHRLCCALCHKYVAPLEPHEADNAYHVCPKCHELSGLVANDDPDLIKNADAIEDDPSRYFFMLKKGESDNKLFDLQGEWRSEINRRFTDYQDDYSKTGYYYDEDASLLITMAINEEPTYIFDNSCLQAITEHVSLYKNVTMTYEEENYVWMIGNKTAKEYVSSATPNKTLVCYNIIYEHTTEHEIRKTPISDCETEISELCLRCGENICSYSKYNHSWLTEECTIDQIKTACPNADVENIMQKEGYNLFIKATCSKCHKTEYIGFNKNHNQNLDHISSYDEYYSFTEGSYRYDKLPYGHLLDENGKCLVCGAQKGQAGDIAFWYRDYDESMGVQTVQIVFANGESTGYDYQDEMKGNVYIVIYNLVNNNGDTIGHLTVKSVQYQGMFYFAVEDLNNHKFEFTSAHDFGADENAQGGGETIIYSSASTNTLPSEGFGFKFSDDSYMAAIRIDDYDGYEQYQIVRAAFHTGETFQIYDFSNQAGWAVSIDSYSFGGNPDSPIWTNYIDYDYLAGTYTVLQDFNAEAVYIKIKMNMDQVYFQLGN